MKGAGLLDLMKIFFNAHDAFINKATVKLELGFTRSSNKSKATPLTFQVSPRPYETTSLIGEGRKFNLEPSFGSTRARSEEHTSELQSQSNLVCRLLLEKKITL